MKSSSPANKLDVQSGNNNAGEEIVISGISGVFPRSDDMKKLFENLVDKTDLTSEFDGVQHPEVSDRFGKLKTWNKFDASFFGMKSRLVNTMDPLGRVLMEKSYEAIVDAGINPGQLRGTKTGVFIGTCFNEAERLLSADGKEGISLIGVTRNMLANRISYWLGIHGTSYSVDAACASSFHALEQAVTSIKYGKCDYALVGGCNHCVGIAITLQFTRLGVVCKDGHSKCFDESADGYSRAEAVVVLLLQKAKNARRIYAGIVNVKTNSDGFKEQGITYPSGLIQAELMKEVYEECNVDPATVDYVEAHATGTKVGDPEEVKAIETVFCPPGRRTEPLSIGSIKSNMGHAEGASGLCSIAKIILMMEHGVMLPNINFKTPNKEIQAFERGTIKVVTETIPWNPGFVGVNNYGYGGSNAHAILRPNKKRKIKNCLPSDDLPRLVCISGRTEEAIDVVFKELEHNSLDAEFIGMLHQIHSDEITGHVFRGSILLKKNQVKVGQSIEHFSGAKRPLWFVYGGIGSQWLTMGSSLLDIPVFARSIEKSHRLLSEKRIDLIEIITSQDPAIFDSILNAFVGITAIQIALTDVLNELEIVPDGIVGHSVGEVACAYADGCLTAEQAILASYYRGLATEQTDLIRGSMAAIGLGYEAMKDKVPADIDIACHNGPDSCTLSGPTESVNKYVESLKSRGIFARVVNVANIAYHSRYIVNIATKLLQYLNQIVTDPKERSSKWISSSVRESEWDTTDVAKYCSAEYMVNNLLSSVYFEEASRKIPTNAVVVEIGPHGLLQAVLRRSLSTTVTNIPLMLRNVNNADFLLTAIGKMYSFGVEMKLHKLYPPIEYPVSSGTKMISPLIRWNHEQNWNVVTLKEQGKLGPAERTVSVSLNDKDWEFLAGHVVDGMNLFPASGYLLLAWETISMMHSKFYVDVSVVFEDVRFHRATILPADGDVEFNVTVQKATGNFEIVESGAAVVSGRVYIPENVNKEMDIEPNSYDTSNLNSDDPDSLPLTIKDVYKLLRLSGYNYNGNFKGITKADSTGTVGCIEWLDNYVSFVDCMMQFRILTTSTRDLCVPISLKKLVIDVNKHRNIVSDLTKNSELSVHVYENLDLIRSGGIEITDLKTSLIARRKLTDNPVLEKHEFVPNQMNTTTMLSTYGLDAVIRIWIHLALENLPSTIKTVKIIEKSSLLSAADQEPVRLITPIISNVLADTVIIQAEMVIFAQDEHPSLNEVDDNITVEYKKGLPADRSAFMVINSDLSTRKDLVQATLDSVMDGGFILSRETAEQEFLQQSEMYGLSLCSYYVLQNERILLLRKQPKFSTIAPPIIVKITADNFSWLPKVQKAIKQLNTAENQKLVIYSEKESQNGILGFFNALRKEPYTDDIRCFFIMDENATSFNLNHAPYKSQLSKDLAVNIYKNGTWGTYRRLPLDQYQKTVRTHHVYVDTLMPGDLSSLRWIEGDINPYGNASNVKDDIIHVHYASLNFKDVLLATGNISSSAIIGNLEQECSLGLEFVGKTADGKRYMGFAAKGKAMTSLIVKNDVKSFIWEVPDQWSLEEAATVPVVYSTALYALLVVGNIRKGESVLIHAGSGGVGQAAINVCLYYGCEIFTTVGTAEKREFIRKTYPQIPDSHIGNSRDTSFVNMVMNQTKKRGVDVVLNSLAEEKLQASVSCLGRNGRFLEIGKFDLALNNLLGMEVFLKNTSFNGIFLDSCTSESREKIIICLNEMIKAGAVKPLARTVFDHRNVEDAFRYMAAGKHIGKIVLKMRDEERGRITASQIPTYDAVPRYTCNPNNTYIICGGLGGFGLELADWLVLRGARNLVLTSRTGIKNGYQSMKTRLWRSYGAKVLISVDDITTNEGVENLLRTANSLGTVSAIFNLAVVLEDAIFENQTENSFARVAAPKAVATELLDRSSRIMCPRLEQFVVFSSMSCSLGNAGQTNYGMANSMMERICELRKTDNLPATTVSWGAIDDVGAVADMVKDSNGIIVGGTAQQKLRSCLFVLDYLLKQPNPIVSSIVIAEKQFRRINQSRSPIDAVADALGLKNLKSISLNFTLSELGMDSILSMEVKQTLEREFEMFVTPKVIRSLTFGNLKEMIEKTGRGESKLKEGIEVQQMQENGIGYIVGKIADEAHASLPVVRIPSLLDNGSTVEVPMTEASTIFILPGFDGNSLMMEPLVANMKVQVLCLQYSFEILKDSVEELALSIYPQIRDRLAGTGQSFRIIGYSYGGLVALKIVRTLEAQGYHRGKLCIIDSSPQYSRDLCKMIFHLDDPEYEQEFQIKYSSRPLGIILWTRVNSEVTDGSREKKDLNDRLDLISSFVPEVEQADHHSKSYKLMLMKSCYKRLKHVLIEENNSNNRTLLSTPTMLIRPKVTPIECADDYGLSQYFQSPVKVHRVNGDYFSVLGQKETANIIESMF